MSRLQNANLPGASLPGGGNFDASLFPENHTHMTPDERERMHILCERIAKERNLDQFLLFVDRLNDLLKHKQRRLARGVTRSEVG